jgi:hypothetical protein
MNHADLATSALLHALLSRYMVGMEVCRSTVHINPIIAIRNASLDPRAKT